MTTPTPTPEGITENPIIECFGNIIGTTIDTESDSNLWIEDVEAVSTVMGLVNDYDGNEEPTEDILDKVITKMENARRIAIMKLHTDITTLLMRYAKPRSSVSGLLGSKKWDRILKETGKSGIRIICRPIKDAEMVLKGINTLFSQTGSISVYIESNYSDDVYEISNVETLSNKSKYNLFEDALVLPIFHESVEHVEYFIYHQNDINPLNNKISCSSCGHFYFDSEYPRFANHGWKQYINYSGFNGDIDDLPRQGTNTTKGLQLIMDMRCRTDKAICNESLNYHYNPMAFSYASAVQYKAASTLIWDLIRDSGLNRILMGDMESFKEAASFYDRKYNDMVKYISRNMEIQSDCFCEHGFSNIKVGHP